MRSILLLSVFFLFLVSCSPAVSSPVATAVTVATVASIESVTASPAPTQTLTPKPAETTTLNVSTTPSARVDEVSYAPDGKYLAKRYDVHGLVGQPAIQIFDQQDELLWQIPYQEALLPDDSRALLNIHKWANDSSGLYFFYLTMSDPALRFYDGYALQKIDVRTGKIEMVLPGTDKISFAFSPDETHIAYSRFSDSPQTLIIRNLSTKSEESINIDSAPDNLVNVGRISWSPSGKHILYHVGDGEHVFAYYLDTRTLQQKKLFEFWLGDNYLLDGWADDEQPRYNDIYGDPRVFVVDVKTGEITIIGTATVQP